MVLCGVGSVVGNLVSKAVGNGRGPGVRTEGEHVTNHVKSGGQKEFPPKRSN